MEWRAYRNSLTLFRTAPSSTPYGASPFPRLWGSQPQFKTAIAISRRYELQIWPLHSHGPTPSEQKPIKNLEKREHGRIQGLDCPIFFECPLLSREWVKLYELQIWQVYSQYPSEQKTVKNFGKSSRGRTQRLSKFFKAPI